MLLAIANEKYVQLHFKKFLKQKYSPIVSRLQVGVALLFTLHGFTELQSWLNWLSIGEKPVNLAKGRGWIN